jgi:hypothetical protein
LNLPLLLIAFCNTLLVFVFLSENNFYRALLLRFLVKETLSHGETITFLKRHMKTKCLTKTVSFSTLRIYPFENFQLNFKGIVSWKFHILFLVSFESLEVSTPFLFIHFLKISSFSRRIFEYTTFSGELLLSPKTVNELRYVARFVLWLNKKQPRNVLYPKILDENNYIKKTD